MFFKNKEQKPVVCWNFQVKKNVLSFPFFLEWLSFGKSYIIKKKVWFKQIGMKKSQNKENSLKL